MIDVKVSHDGVDDEEPPSWEWIEQVVRRTLAAADFQDACEVSVLLTDEARIRELNRDYRGLDKPTDVLSFAFEDDDTVHLPPGVPRVLGDVILSLPVLQEQAVRHNGSFPRECAWALCHGTLHLLGYDHQTDQEEQAMRALESDVLSGFEERFFSW